MMDGDKTRAGTGAAAAEQGESSDLQEDYAALLYENQKLKKINQVLMQRVEMGWGNHSDAYRSFESAALLADKVKERTRELRQTLNRLEESNEKLARARAASERDRQILRDAIESIPESFALFDAQRRLLLSNSRFRTFWSAASLKLEVGLTRLPDLKRAAAGLGFIDKRARIRGKAEAQAQPGQPGELVFRLQNGHWIQMSEHPTSEGGLVVIYTDITSIKESEKLRRQREVAEQALILQSTLENMSEGVALVNGDCKLESWNRRFVELSGLDTEMIERGVNFQQLLAATELGDTPIPGQLSNCSPGEVIYMGEKTLASGLVLLVRRHAIAGGGFLDTYADITDRFKNEEALRESEQRIRLITDAMPAMISYVTRDLRYEFVNRYFEDWFDRPRSSILGQSLPDLLATRDYHIHRPYIDSALHGRQVNFEVEQTLDGKKSRNFRKTYIPHFDGDKKVVGFFSLEQDITQQRRTAQALQQAYEHMEQRVSVRTREISTINQQLRKEIDERQLVEASLIEAKKAADLANESKTKFLAAASHDLLQPMNAARLFSAALNDLELPASAIQLVNSLSYSLEDVESLISALVDISKLEAGVVEPVPETFMVDELLGKLVNEYSAQAAKAGLQLGYVKSSAAIHTDSQLLARILRNILTNAIRYTPAGKIVLGCRRRTAGLQIQVWDTGIGIPQDKIHEIFEEFSRVDPKQRRSDKGLGLGLAIVDRIARVLGHRVKVKSKLGQGSCFSILIPYGVIEADRGSAALELDTLGRSIFGASVLVIDNDSEICAGMRALLEGWKCHVTTVQSIEELVQLQQGSEQGLQLMIADYHLDDNRTGLEAIALLEKQLQRTVPVILITANYSNELRQLARDSGYVLMNKPIKPLKLKAVMANILGN
ncbi:MAG: PAS domain-containing protein [Gammaproteobacteria bacterium]|nr:PAS domain-containing protein [Gammaproteobacteria bacterium]